MNLLYAFLFSHHRKTLGLTQIELSQKLGITQPLLHYIETGQRAATLELIEDLAKIVGVSVEDLVYKAMVVYIYKI
jgi:transcriptional regulator with XRE-family HTH domain